MLCLQPLFGVMLLCMHEVFKCRHNLRDGSPCVTRKTEDSYFSNADTLYQQTHRPIVAVFCKFIRISVDGPKSKYLHV